MGEPAQIVCREHTRGVFIYLHYGGDENDMAKLVYDAVEHAKPRWNDGPYGTRMVISYVLNQVGILDETGVGISDGHMDEAIPAYVIDFGRQTVYRGRSDPSQDVQPRKQLTFRDFLAQPFALVNNGVFQ